MKVQELKKIHLRRNSEELRGKISDLGSQYLRRYNLCNLGFLQAPEFHIKEVTLVKSS